jgi:hypothetical protein
MPYLTVHDLTHLDALWEIGSLIAGPAHAFTPAEGYVYGAAVLLHDAAMSIAAFPGGLEEIVETDEWKDTIVMLTADPESARSMATDLHKLPQEIIGRAVPVVLRLLHAKQAEFLPRKKWRNAAGEAEYLIENADLRDFYGPIVGKIARSHGESISSVQQELAGTLGSLALPSHS